VIINPQKKILKENERHHFFFYAIFGHPSIQIFLYTILGKAKPPKMDLVQVPMKYHHTILGSFPFIGSSQPVS
jgi:hypothetical protein